MRLSTAIKWGAAVLFVCTASSVSVAKAEVELVLPIEGDPVVDVKLARIGWHLFRDPNLSSNGKVSCESCHNLQTNGAQNTAVAAGVKGAGIRNAITVFNASLNYRLLWDGSSNTLVSQMDGPIHDPLEMDSNWPKIESYVQNNEQYQALFKRAGNLPISIDNIKASIVEFVKGLETPGAPFDAYLLGYTHVLSEKAKRGWKTFQKAGCVQCHQGKNVGGAMIQRFAYFEHKPVQKDTGRHLLTTEGDEGYYFRVASLRNVALTGPYFHNGQVTTLAEAIKIMAQTQLGITMSDSNIEDIEAFLTSLSAPRPVILEVLENE